MDDVQAAWMNLDLVRKVDLSLSARNIFLAVIPGPHSGTRDDGEDDESGRTHEPAVGGCAASTPDKQS
jgi:hypothetical protein